MHGLQFYKLVCLIVFGLLHASLSLAADDDLPDIGSPADSVLSKEQEQILGRSIYKGLRDTGQVMSDPEIQEYIQNVGQRISANAQEMGFRFQFFAVDAPSINAFALPGGYIGIHSGLMLATKTESELAGVLAHEVSHVTQRHISRAVFANQRTSILTMAAMLGAILVGAATGEGDVIAGGIVGAQSLAAQGQINFTRENEYEADRVGVGLLAASGFDPYGMPNFFATLARQTASEFQAPEFLRTHPVTVNRIAETRSRAANYAGIEAKDSAGYSLTKARMRVLRSNTPEKALTYFSANLESANSGDRLGNEYGLALALGEAGQWSEARDKFSALLNENAEIIHFHSGYATALAETGNMNEAINIFKEAIKLFPRNVPLTIRYAEILMRNNDNKDAHQLLLDLYNQVPPTPVQVRQLALAANAAGDTADAHYYMAEYHLLSGDLVMASDQLVIALGMPGLDSVQKARFRSRLEQIQEFMPKRKTQQRNGRSQLR